MKRLLIVNGPMGAGKTTVCRELQRLLPANVFLDGDWCWDMRPFVVTEETKAMVMENIAFLVNAFLRCDQYENVLFCWVLPGREALDALLSRLHTESCDVRVFTLTLSKAALIARLQNDIDAGLRTADVIPRSLDRLSLCDGMNTEKIDVSRVLAAQAARDILARL